MALPKDTYLEFSLMAPQAGSRYEAEAQSFFRGAGISSGRIVLTTYHSRARWSFYTRSAQELKKTLRYYGIQKPSLLKSKVRSLGPKDWRDRWQLYFHTMPLGRKFTIVPVWESRQFKASRSPGRIPLFLDPCGAFGSGAHETTRLMIRMMEPLEGQFQSFLDIGTGTGILAAAALKLGATRIEGVDIDPDSAAAARRNFKLNGGSKQGLFRAQDILKRQNSSSYDMVAANFISADLEACQKPILRQVTSKGVLLLSGISLRNLPGFLRSFNAPGFRRVNLIRGRSWAGLIYRRNS